MAKILVVIVLSSLFPANLMAQEFKNEFGHVVSVNVLTIPVAAGVVAYEGFWNQQSVWLGLENRFNDLVSEDDRTVRSAALEYRRYFRADDRAPEGVFAGVYSKFRTGEEFSMDLPQHFHRYSALFAGANIGYQLLFRFLFASVFVGYGMPIWMEEEHSLAGTGLTLNEGHDQDVRIGLTIGFGF
ncbi:MAG: hypothetical protein ACLFQS_06650 [Bacteroidales bacterium]